jgi:hypothetical protein
MYVCMYLCMYVCMYVVYVLPIISQTVQSWLNKIKGKWLPLFHVLNSGLGKKQEFSAIQFLSRPDSASDGRLHIHIF